MLAYIICNELDFGESKGTNVYQVNIFAFLAILILIFLVRTLIYSLIFTSKEHPFTAKGSSSFLYVFSERHLFQAFGLFSFFIWISPLEGNIIGFFVFPLTLILGLVVSIITFVRVLKTKKLWLAKNK
jgi:hypothetical protein